MSVRAEPPAAGVVVKPSDLLGLLPDAHGFAFVSAASGLIGWGQAERVEVPPGPQRFQRAAAALRDAFGRLRDGWRGLGPIAFGSFTFDERGGGSSLVIPSCVVRHTSGRDPSLVTGGRVSGLSNEIDTSAAAPRIRYAGSTLSEVEWLEAVDEAVAEIRRGPLEKVVLARDLVVWAKEELDNRTLAARLAHRFPECFTFIHGTLVGATPELLIRRTGESVESLVLAGTARRAAREADDAAVGAALMSSGKDKREHEFAVHSVTRVLAVVCDELTVDEAPFLLKLANVQHLATRVKGHLAEPLSALQLAGRLHPTAAVCGTPRGEAERLIRRLERMDRGRYAGPVGWVDASGDGEFGIALRCAEVTGARARLFAGNGIVADSRPEAELEETRLKLRAMQSALNDS
jgi:menaquinone-specific isochorismate synthase